MLAPVKFLYWVLGIVFALGLAGSFGKLTYEMAMAAMDAQEHHQMSYGAYSRKLWAGGSLSRERKRNTGK